VIRFKYLLFSCLLGLFCIMSAKGEHPYQFVSPKPGSIVVSNETNLIFRYSGFIDGTGLSTSLIMVEGSESGEHAGELILSDDGRTIVFNPDLAFASEEEVYVELAKGIRTRAGDELPGFTFHFSTAPERVVQLPTADLTENMKASNKSGTESLLPAPPITIDSINDPSPGYIFMATWDRNVPAMYGNFIFVLDKNGAIVDSLRVKGAAYDFQVQPNGLLSFALGDFSSNVPLPGEDLRHIVLDENLSVVDSFSMKNGYTADFHEFKMIPNGHVMMMSYHTILYDMSTVIDSGRTDASLVINIIQEQDRDKNVVFEWRNIDYIPITDSDLDLTGSRLNYSTLNGFDIDEDGNILASFRNHSEIMKISRTTGEIMWRMGSPRGEFSFEGEHEENAPYYFARQHHIRRRPNGNITIFDNGAFHQPPYSRAVEYELDEVNKVARMVSDWRYPAGNIFCVTAGNAELLPNGGWFIGYGVPHKQFVNRNAVEVHPDGSIALELSLPESVLAYRIYKLPWKETLDISGFIHYEVREGNTYSFNNDSITTGIEIIYNSLEAADYNESMITRYPRSPVHPEFTENIQSVSTVSVIYEGLGIDSQSAEFHFDLSAFPEIRDPENTSLYYRKDPDQGLFIQKTTAYDTVNNELIATLDGFGEIVFGVPYQDAVVNIPILYEPLNQQELVMADSVNLRWTGKGMYNSFNVQISDDSTFSTILEKSNTNLSDYTVIGLTKNKEYFWRVNSVLGDQTGLWSEVWNFRLTDTTTSVVELETGIPHGYRLAQNFPNPFNSSTIIFYSIQKPGFVTLKIYDPTGREIQTLVSENQETGIYSVEFKAHMLSGGVDFYRLQAGNQFTAIKKMLLTGE